MFVLLFILAGVLLQKSSAVTKGVPEILNNGTLLDTEDNDIAHITCTSRAEPRPVIRWEKEGIVVKDKDEGIAILSRSNGSIEESHLFVAVTSNNRRGEYICVVTNEKGVSKQSFRIKGKSNKLSRLDIAAICISVGISLFLLFAIGCFLWRGAKRRKLPKGRERARTISQCSQENGALIGDSPETPPTKECRNGITKSNTCVTTV